MADQLTLTRYYELRVRGRVIAIDINEIVILSELQPTVYRPAGQAAPEKLEHGPRAMHEHERPEPSPFVILRCQSETVAFSNEAGRLHFRQPKPATVARHCHLVTTVQSHVRIHRHRIFSEEPGRLVWMIDDGRLPGHQRHAHG